MSFSVGIVGLPNVGKSTLFKALTKQKVAISPRPFTTIHPNIGLVSVPDERLLKVSQVIKPERVTPTTIEFVDIAGLIKDAHKGEGLGNQFLSHIRNCDAILEIVRTFDSPEVENVLGEINPEKEIEIVKLELLMKDLETLENLTEKTQKKVPSTDGKKTQKKIELLEKIKELVSRGKLISEIDLTSEEKLAIKDYQFLTEKPVIYLLNINNKTFPSSKLNVQHLAINLKDEEEISELPEKDKKELGLSAKLDDIIKACYIVLDLITFFTIKGGKETRAWTLKRGLNAKTAAGKVHSDFEERFIKAEVVPWQKLIEAGSWSGARERGWLQLVGKDYLVQDGDIIEIKI